MYSMNYIGKFIANFREFYNEINGATLTGAIDVVVVEQPDGSFTCSPFHVRFGKLGVLRSRFKVVDLELNGEPLNIHMKLGESGEAFFVEEVGDEDADYAAHLATSPIPAGRFDLYEPRRRNSLSAVEPDHGQASDYTKRRYTADAQSMQKPDLSKLIKKDSISKEKQDSHDDHDALFEMEGIDEVQPSWTESKLPKTFSATKLGEEESEATQAVQMISAHNDFRPIESASQDDKLNGNGKKKKKTRKSSSKKKHQRKSSTSSISSQSDRAGSEQRPQCESAPITTDINFFSDSEVNTAADILSEEMSNMQLTGENRIPLALSDTAFEVHAASRLSACVETSPVVSDTEVELSRGGGGGGAADAGEAGKSQSWRWGELPSPPPRPPGVLQGVWRFMSNDPPPPPPPHAEGVYLDDLDRGQVDPHLYLSTHHAHNAGRRPPTEEEYESGNGPSLPQSPASLPPPTHDSDDDDKILAKGGVGVYVREEGGSVSRVVPFEEFASRGGQLLQEGRLLVRLGDRYLPWRTAGPLLLSLLAYRRPLPNRVLESLEKETGKDENATRAESKARGYSWWSWRRSNSETKRAESTPPKDANTEEAPQTQLSTSLPKTLEETIELSRTGTPLNANEGEIVAGFNIDDIVEPTAIGDLEEIVVHHGDQPILDDDKDNKQTEHIDNIDTPIHNNIAEEILEQPENSSSDSDQDGQIPKRHTRRHSSFRKTLRLSSDQIRKLNLRVGMNEMVFSVTTAYQGTTRCKCNVFRWRHDDKIVISDIDGTITKSDVLGHIFPLVGKDWAQSGVAQLFTKIKNNGYQLLYLSARAIGQAKVTREYLRSIKQGEVCLPDGPLLLNPTSLLRAFHREVIEKKPEEFKIQCLADIKALFPQGSNPFYAGYGNRVNDVCAYQAVGIPIVRIFTINYKGELKHELTQTFQSTYSHMSVLVDQVFPPALCEPSDEFSQTLYWREPLPTVDIIPIPTAALTKTN